MIKPKAKSRFPYILKIASLIALLAIGFLGYRLVSSSSLPPQPIIQQKEAKQSDSVTKQAFIENNTSSSGTPASNNGSSLDNIKINTSQTSDSVIVTTELYKYSSGNCYILVKNGDRSFTQTVSILYQPTFSTCTGFSIPKTSLGTGNWSISLSVTEGATTLTKSTSLDVN